MTNSPSAVINCTDQVRIWISADGLPQKHQARLARLRAFNPEGRILLIVSRSVLEPAAAAQLDEFSARLDVDLMDIARIDPVDEEEALILEHIEAEIRSSFWSPREAIGNLSVVSDYARLLEFVVGRGVCADMDVEFCDPMRPAAATTPCPLGVLSRFKQNGRLTNDVTAGLPQSKPFVLARQQVAQLIRTYRDAACGSLRDLHGETCREENVSAHPLFFELRNKQHDDVMSGTARFSLTGGPDNFAIAFHRAGLFCGYESEVQTGDATGELVPGHVPHTLLPNGPKDGRLPYQRFRFGPPPSDAEQLRQRRQLWPDCLPAVMSNWDHSWITGHSDWQALTYYETRLLALLNGPDWSLDAATSLTRPRVVPPCPLGAGSAEWAQSDRRRARAAPKAAPPSAIRERSSPRDPRQELRGNGIAAIHGLLDEPMLRRLRACFETEIRKKAAANSLNQFAFNLAVDDCELTTIEQIRELAMLPTLVETVDEFLGGPSRFVSARGYRQGPSKPIRYRAWDYHQDMKTNGPFEEVKVMVLLTEVAPDGQAMRFACGSHALQWRHETQQDTKFTLDEALELGERGLFIAHGPAGTCIVFDTNGIHSGHRNLSTTRDVVTLNFLRESPEAFFMFADPRLTAGTVQPSGPAPSRTLVWRTTVADENTVNDIRTTYRSTPDLAATRPSWNGDVLQLVDVIAADLHVDLDLRLSAVFEDDRARDIGLVEVRDASFDHAQYQELVTRVDELRCGSEMNADRSGEARDDTAAENGACLLHRDDPIQATVGVGRTAAVQLSRHPATAEAAAAEHCRALIDDLCEALGRIDTRQRMRTTIAFLYFAVAWAHRLLPAADGRQLESSCRQVLHLYLHLAADDIVEATKGTTGDD